MRDPSDIMISVKSQYAESLMQGRKTAEIRRRAISISEGGRVWIYSKMPTGSIVAVATVQSLVRDRPRTIWDVYGSKADVSCREFFEYFMDADVGYAIIFSEVRTLEPAIHLSKLRQKLSEFHPPQFFLRLEENSRLLHLLRSAVT